MDGRAPTLAPARLVCHCLLIATEAGLVLVDTGLGVHDVRHPHPRLSRFFTGLLRPIYSERETALHQVRALGFDPRDVRHIVLTHLDFDHAGGIEDFPEASVHVYAPERRAIQHRATFVARGRYRPRQWDDLVEWQTYEVQGERWFGFEAVRELRGLPPELLLVPLVGHTPGHCGIAIDRGERWMLHAGDAYFYREEMRADTPHCTVGLAGYQRLMEVDRQKRLANQGRLRELARQQGAALDLFCAHDAHEFDAHARAEEEAGRGVDLRPAAAGAGSAA